MKTIAFFNNKGGVGKTTLVYHVAWMFNELGIETVVLDLDPQANLTTAFLDEDRLEELWPNGEHPQTIFGALAALHEHLGDLGEPYQEEVADHLTLVPGDLALGRFEERLSEAWGKCLEKSADAFRVSTAFYRAAERVAKARQARVVLIDVGPSLGALNRAALVASDFVVMPLAADLFSLQGLRNLGPTLSEWRTGWTQRRALAPDRKLPLPGGAIEPAGYILLQHAVRSDRPVKAHKRWAERIPSSYHEEILGEPTRRTAISNDPSCLAELKHYRSLMPLAHDARKPMFLLKAADGAIGGHAAAVEECGKDFKKLATRLFQVCSL